MVNGNLSLSQLAYLSNMTMEELVPEVLDMVMRSSVNSRRFDDDEVEYYSVDADGRIRFIPQIVAGIHADNDPRAGDKEREYAQEHGLWSPPSLETPRVVVVAYWLDTDRLYYDAYDEEDNSKTDALDARIDKLISAARSRARLRQPSDLPWPEE